MPHAECRSVCMVRNNARPRRRLHRYHAVADVGHERASLPSRRIERKTSVSCSANRHGGSLPSGPSSPEVARGGLSRELRDWEAPRSIAAAWRSSSSLPTRRLWLCASGSAPSVPSRMWLGKGMPATVPSNNGNPKCWLGVLGSLASATRYRHLPLAVRDRGA